MGMRDKKRNQKRVLARRTAAPRSGEGKDFLVSGSPLSSTFFFLDSACREVGGKSSGFLSANITLVLLWRLALRLVQPLEEGPGKRLRKVQQPEEPENTATVVYIGHIPHGFYEDQMQGAFLCDNDERWNLF
jgi:nucleolar protein 15